MRQFRIYCLLLISFLAINAEAQQHNQLVHDASTSWANGSSAGTTKDLDLPAFDNPHQMASEARYLICVVNSSPVSALTVLIKNREVNFDGQTRFPELTRFGVAASTTEGTCVIVQGWLLGSGGRLTLSNDSAVGASDGFNAYLRVRIP